MTSKEKLLILATEGIDETNWYRDATLAISALCEDVGWCPERFITALAVLSPRVTVTQNITLTIAWFLHRTPPKVPETIAISFENLLAGGYEVTAIKGPKTRRFADALLGDTGAVVLDTHMGYALNVDPTKLRNKGIQEEAEKRIRWVGAQLGHPPRDIQAAIWSAQRGRAGLPVSRIDYDTLSDTYTEVEATPF